jgi:hypothetical protein
MTDTKRVIVTGSRDWEAVPPIHGILWKLYDEAQRKDQSFIVVHGDCPSGADLIAKQWVLGAQAVGHPRLTHEPHPAEWDQYGRTGGPRRNREMVELGADLCLAFILPCRNRRCRNVHGSHGATHCRNEALAAGIRTISDERWTA